MSRAVLKHVPGKGRYICDVGSAIQKVPGMRQRGLIIGRALDDLFTSDPAILQALLDAIKTKTEDTTSLREHVDKIINVIAKVTGCTDVRRGVEMGWPCEVRPLLLSSLRKFLKDPDDQVEAWFRHGAPLGIKEYPIDRNIFPRHEEETVQTKLQDLMTEEPGSRRTMADDDPDALAELENLVKRGWAKKVASTRAAKNFVRGPVVVSRLIVITKERKYKDERGKVVKKLKKRLILNLKRSGITAAAAKMERPELPRTLDIIFSNLELMRKMRDLPGWRLRHIILDFVHAFFNFPGCESERC